MGYIHCCSGLHKTRSFVVVPNMGFISCEMDYLKKCPVCGNLIVQLTRIADKDNVSAIRYHNSDAIAFLKKIKPKILYEKKFVDYSKTKRGKFYLNYNEYGVKKRCYSNLSNLKIGLNSTI